MEKVVIHGTQLDPSLFLSDNSKYKTLLAETPIDSSYALHCLSVGQKYRFWYQDSYNTFVTYLPDYDMDLFIKVFAATSPLSHPVSNLSMALKAYTCIKEGIDTDTIGCINSVRVMLKDIQQGVFEQKAGNSRRKILNFIRALSGDKDAIVIDSRTSIAFGVGRTYKWNNKTVYRLPTVREVKVIEFVINLIAEELQYQPREVSAMIWAGARMLKGKFKESGVQETFGEHFLEQGHTL